MSGNLIISVDVKHAVDLTADVGKAAARRASMLMAYGLNSENLAPNADFHLPGFIQLVDAPRKLSSPEMDAFRSEFRDWIVANGFRELLEGMEVFSNSYHRIALNAEIHLGSIGRRKADKLLKQFEKLGVGGKLKLLERRYGFETGFAHYFDSLTRARNCLTHRQGVVGDKDCEEASELRITWLGIDAEITEHDGTKHFIGPETLGPFDSSKFNQGGNAQLTAIMVDRELVFQRGEHVIIPPRHLQEICSMTAYTSLKMRQLLLNWLIKKGLNVNNGQPVQDPIASISLEEFDSDAELLSRST